MRSKRIWLQQKNVEQRMSFRKKKLFRQKDALGGATSEGPGQKKKPVDVVYS